MSTLKRVVYHEDDAEPWKTREELTAFCCFDPGYSLTCEETRSSWGGYTIPELDLNLDDEGKNADGVKVVVHFKERVNPCGFLIEEYDDKPKDCCDGVDSLTPDLDASAEVIDAPGSAKVYVDGGKHPITWKVTGIGFFVNAAKTKKETTIDSNGLVVYTDENACGTCRIKASDGCSETELYLRSIAGEWREIPANRYGSLKIHADTLVSYGGTSHPCGRGFLQLEGINSRFRARQTYVLSWAENDPSTDYVSCEGACSGVTEDWQQFIEDAKSQRAPLEGEPELISLDDMIEIPYNLIYLPQNWAYADPVYSSDAMGVVKSCNSEGGSPYRCTTGAAVFAAGMGVSCPSTNPRLWEWVCGEE